MQGAMESWFRDRLSIIGMGDLFMFPFNTLNNVDVDGKKVLLRTDINSPLHKETLKIEDDTKINAACRTIIELNHRNAGIVLIAHQGRRNSWDFTDLSQHAELLQERLGKEVRYIDDLLGEDAKRAIASVGSGDMILLKNLRSFEGETARISPTDHAKSALVSSLAHLFDLFVNDAFASAHRIHASIVGFPMALPSAMGRLMGKELRIISEIVENPERPCVFVFGGNKFVDAIPVIRNLLEKRIADRIILGGLIGLVFSVATGKNIGTENMKKLREELLPEFSDEAKAIALKYAPKIAIPVDMALDKEGSRIEWEINSDPPALQALDLGQKSISHCLEILSNARTVLISGPVGVFEREEFSAGTRAIFEKSTSSGAFCVIGGGHTTAAANQLGFRDKISYDSTGGGAMEYFLSGKTLPAVEALTISMKKFR